MKMRRRKGQADQYDELKHDLDVHIQQHRKQTTRLRLLLAGLLILVLAVGTGLAYWYVRNQQRPEQATQALQEVLQVREADNQANFLRSDYGFEVHYNKDYLHEHAFVRNKDGFDEKAEDEVSDTTNDYALVVLTLKDNESPGNSILDEGFEIRSADLWITTVVRENFFADQRAKLGDKTDQEIAVDHFLKVPREDTSKETLTGQKEVEIKGKKFTELTYTYMNEKYDIPTPDGGRKTYITVQNGRPYQFTMRYYEFTSAPNVRLLENIIDTATFFPPPAGTLLGASQEVVEMPTQGVLAETTQSADEDLPEASANVPKDLRDGTALGVVAKNQLAVVRIGSLDCKDFDVLLPNGSVGMTVKNGCSNGVGTGSLVSSDGYVSTNGHVVKHGFHAALQGYMDFSLAKQNTQPTKDFMSYLLATNVATEAQLQALVRGINSGDQAAFEKLFSLAQKIPIDRFKLGAERGEYAIQLSDEPIKLNITGEQLSFNYSKEVVKAEFKDMNYDQNSTIKDMKPNISDVAILKTKGTYPVARLGSLNDVQKGSFVTSIGFPAFVDDGLLTKQPRTIPTVTQGIVENVLPAVGPNDSLQLAATNVPTAQGNSGGPVFNDSGVAVGLTTYGGSTIDPTAGVTKFGPGAMRNAADFTALLQKNSITLDTNSEITKNWTTAIDSFSRAHYAAALPLFNKVKEAYPEQYLVEEFASAAQAKIDSGEDETPNNTLVIVGLVVFVSLIASAILVTIIIVRHHKKGPQPPAAQPPVAPTPPAPVQPAQPIPPQPIAPIPVPPVQPAVPPLQLQAVVVTQPVPPAVDAAPVPQTVIEPAPTGVSVQIPHDQSQ
jgi:hypothetical protein